MSASSVCVCLCASVFMGGTHRWSLPLTEHTCSAYPPVREATIRISLRWAIKLKRLVETLTPTTLCAFALPLLLWILTLCLPSAQVPEHSSLGVVNPTLSVRALNTFWTPPRSTIDAFVIVVNYLMTVNKRTGLIFRVRVRVHSSISLDKPFFG